MKQASKKALSMLIFILVVACLVEQGKAKFCSSTFISALVQLIPCRPALYPFRPIPPSETCCNALKALGQPCICALLNSPPISGVDRNLAVMLPQKCAANFDPCI